MRTETLRGGSLNCSVELAMPLRENHALILAIRAEYPSSWAEVGTAFGMSATNAEQYYNLITGILTLIDVNHANISYDLLNYLAGVGG